MSNNIEIEYEIKPAGKFSFNLKELWQYRELFYFFAWRDIKVKYKQTILGFLWAILQPLLMMVIFTLFFGNALNVPSDGIPYPVFAYSGILIWNLFSTGLSNAATSMVNNANIIKKIYFPRLIIPISSILVAVVDLFITFFLFLVLMIIYSNELSIDIFRLMFFFPLALVITLLTTFGAGTFLAALNVKYRDFRYIIPFLIQTLLFLTPVIYPVSAINNPLVKALLIINPITSAVNLSRSCISDNPIDWFIVSLGLGVSILLFLAGFITFRKTEAFFADIA